MEPFVLSESVVRYLRSCVYDPAAEPNFEIIKTIISWSDEWPLEGLTSEVLEVMHDLWIARKFMHHDEHGDGECPVFPEYEEHCRQVWHAAREQAATWPGFREDRLRLSAKDRAYYEYELAHMDEF